MRIPGGRLGEEGWSGLELTGTLNDEHQNFRPQSLISKNSKQTECVVLRKLKALIRG